MKKIRTILCILFAAVMLTAMAAPAFAESSGSSTYGVFRQSGEKEKHWENYEVSSKSHGDLTSGEIAELPETGGPGAALLYAFGGVLVLGTGVFLVTERRGVSRR